MEDIGVIKQNNVELKYSRREFGNYQTLVQACGKIGLCLFLLGFLCLLGYYCTCSMGFLTISAFCSAGILSLLIGVGLKQPRFYHLVSNLMLYAGSTRVEAYDDFITLNMCGARKQLRPSKVVDIWWQEDLDKEREVSVVVDASTMEYVRIEVRNNE